MENKTIGQHMVDIMNENELNIIWWGMLDQVHECAERSGMYNRTKTSNGNHPLNIYLKVMNGVERSIFFEKGYIKHIRRPSRAFFLKEEYKAKIK